VAGFVAAEACFAGGAGQLGEAVRTCRGGPRALSLRWVVARSRAGGFDALHTAWPQWLPWLHIAVSKATRVNVGNRRMKSFSFAQVFSMALSSVEYGGANTTLAPALSAPALLDRFDDCSALVGGETVHHDNVAMVSLNPDSQAATTRRRRPKDSVLLTPMSGVRARIPSLVDRPRSHHVKPPARPAPRDAPKR
jgi:hypothetical protein